MSNTQNVFYKPFGFSGQAGFEEYRWKATAAMLMIYAPIGAYAARWIGVDVTLLAVAFGLLYNLVWFLPLMVRRGRSAGMHWLVSVVLGVVFTLPFAIVLAFLPEKDKGDAQAT